VLGFSFGEILVISLVALVAVGPQKLPGMLKTMGQWVRKLRQMTMDVRQQTGIDEMLRAEGIQLAELRSLMRGYHAPVAHTPAPAPSPAPAPAPAPRYEDPYNGLEPDPTREYPLEGADAYGALPDDLLEPASSTEVGVAPGAPPPVAELAEPLAPAEPEAAVAEPTEESPQDVTAALEAPSEPEPAQQHLAPEPAQQVEPSSVPPASSPRRSAPPPPPVRVAVPRPSSSAPPPPPRRSSGPPRPEPASAAPSTPEAAPAGVAPGSGNADGNG
jgi:sec-independent protein translocase protein TatB